MNVVFKKPWLIICFLVSLFFILLAVILSYTGVNTQTNIWKALFIIIIAQFGSAIFFPMVVGYFYDKIRQSQETETIWNVFRDLSDGGIIRVYTDREKNDRTQNALIDLDRAFQNHREGEVCLIGVSLRVFFNQPGPFYQSIYQICKFSKQCDSLGIRALVSNPESPEVQNRAAIETPGMQNDPLIKIDISSTVKSIENLNTNFPNTPISYGYYDQAPYCTCVLFPDKCYFSPNILATDPPVRLPMIVFQKESHGYQKLSQYFEYLWENQPKS